MIVDLHADGGELVVRPLGHWRVWALKGSVRVPLDSITTVRHDVARRDAPLGLRIPGTHLPAVVTAGTYRGRGLRSFWVVGRARTVTVVEVGAGSTWDRLVLQLDPGQRRQLDAMVG